MNLAHQIMQAKKHVRRMKRTVPYIFGEYSELHEARRVFKEAKARLQRAERIWKELGQ